MRPIVSRSGLIAALAALASGCGGGPEGAPPDEALQRLRERGGEYADLRPDSDPEEWRRAAEAYYPPAYRDYFEDMDAIGTTDEPGAKPLELGPEEIKGRNAWVIWTGGNEAWWDWLARYGYGSIDLLKLIDDRRREDRFARSGLINEPGTRPPTPEETKESFGVRYARPIEEPTPDGEEHVEYRWGRDQRPNPRIYGYPTGVVGLRLFENPEFWGDGASQKAARRTWNPELYYSDTPEGREYAARPDTIRPFRVGMSCGYCHIAPHPLKPPADPEFPEWENLSNNVGNQFMRMRVAFGNALTSDNYLYHVFDSMLPGAVDTSGYPSDNNNNPNTINSFYGLRGRLARAQHTPLETLSPDSLAYVANYTDEGADNPKHLPRVLLDGSDSVGVHIALARVYLNIGTHHQQWIRTINPLLGFHDQSPFKLADVAGNSLYWHAIRIRVPPLAAFFQASTDPMRLKDVQLADEDGEPVWVKESRPDGKPPRTLEDYLKEEDHLRGTGLPWYTADSGNGEGGPPLVGGPGDYSAGRRAFARGCIACHSSVQPGDLLALERKLDAGEDRAEDGPDGPDELPRDLFNIVGGGGGGDGGNPGLLPPLVEVPPDDWTGTREEWDRLMDRTLAGRRRLRLTHEDRARLTRGDGELPPAYAEWARQAVEHREFWEHQARVWDGEGNAVLDEDDRQKRVTVHNYLSIDERLPITIPRTNSGRATGTNSRHGQVWDDFASLTFKELGAVGPIEYRDPFSGAVKSFSPPGEGPGYYRVPTLISIWATSPLLHNNALGLFNNDPSVEGRLASFDDAIERLLWPDRRRDPSEQAYWPGVGEAATVYDAWYPEKNADEAAASNVRPPEAARLAAAHQRELDGGWIWRTTEESWLMFDAPHVPMLVGGVVGLSREQMRLVAWVPALIMLFLGIALLLSGPLIAVRDRLERRFTWLDWLFSPIRWLVVVVGLLLLVATSYLILHRLRPAVTLLDLGTGESIRWFRAQAFLIPVVLLASVIIIALPTRVWAGRTRLLAARAFGVACLVLAVVTAAGLGRTLAGIGADVKVGPIPEGIPVNVVANFDPDAPRAVKIAAAKALVDFLAEHHEEAEEDTSEEAKARRRREFEERVAPALLRASKCPDFVTDRGHDYVFIRDFTDEEKRELIALLKTF